MFIRRNKLILLYLTIFSRYKNLLQVFAIEYVTFVIDFVPFAVEFVTFAVEFVSFVIEFVGFAIEFVALANYIDCNKLTTLELISLFVSDHTHH